MSDNENPNKVILSAEDWAALIDVLNQPPRDLPRLKAEQALCKAEREEYCHPALGTSVEDAYARLAAGEYSGTLAEEELRSFAWLLGEDLPQDPR